VISHLGERYVAEVEDIVNSPPPRDPYTHLKNELIQRLCPTKEQRAQQLFEFEEMGDRRPSQFLRHLRTLAPDIPSDYLWSLWSSRLPANVRAILAGLPDVELEAAALCTDRIMEAIPVPAVASISPDSDHKGLQQKLSHLSCQVSELRAEQVRLDATLRQIQASLRLLISGERRPGSASRRSSGLRSNTSSPDPNNTECWYHRRYGAQAQRCTKPCTFRAPEN
jgi:hypothetical protein